MDEVLNIRGFNQPKVVQSARQSQSSFKKSKYDANRISLDKLKYFGVHKSEADDLISNRSIFN